MANSGEPIEHRVWAALDRGDPVGALANDVSLGERTVQRYAAARRGFDQGFKGAGIKGVAPWTSSKLDRVLRSYREYRSKHPRPGVQPVGPPAADRTETIRQRLEERLWWPNWADVPEDLGQGPFPRVLYSGARELRWERGWNGRAPRPLVQELFENIDEQDLVDDVGLERAGQILAIAKDWQREMGEYLDLARARRVVQSSEFSDGSRRGADSQLRQAETVLLQLKDQLLLDLTSHEPYR